MCGIERREEGVDGSNCVERLLNEPGRGIECTNPTDPMTLVAIS